MDDRLLQFLSSATLAASAAIVIVAALRVAARRALGAGIAYGLWSLVPVAVLAALVPAPAATIAAARAIPQMPAVHVVSGADAATVTQWPVVVIAIWLGGAFLFGMALVLRQRRFVRAIASESIELEPFEGVPVSRARGAAHGPLVVGAVRTKIVLPADFAERYDANERALILAHERMHVRRGDGIANALLAALRALFWFNPLVHFAANPFRFDQELACDAAVLRSRPAARRAYAQAMLKTQLTDPGLPVGCAWQSSQPLKVRILMLKQDASSKLRTRLSACALGLVVASFGALTLAAQPAPAKGAAVSTDVSYRSMTPVKYPKSAIDAKAEGDVKVVVLVASDGSVKEAHVDESSAAVAQALKDSAVEGVKTWRFNPARHDGKPIEQRVALTISYRLDEHDQPDAAPGPSELDSIRVAPGA